jgi:hypothetical protein
MHRRNPLVTAPVSDVNGFAEAIHRVEWFESMVVFHVDRRLCGRSEALESGPDCAAPSGSHPTTLHDAAVAVLESQPSIVQWLMSPARRVIGSALRMSRRSADSNRVRRYFR